MLMWGMALISRASRKAGSAGVLARPGSASNLSPGSAAVPSRPMGRARTPALPGALPFGMLLLSLSILFRPSALLLPIVLAAIIPASAGRRTARIAWCAALIVACLFPWALRNRLTLGSWVWLTTNGGITRYDGFQPAATGASNQSFVQLPEFARARLMTEVQRDAFFSSRAHSQFRSLVHEDFPQLVRLTALKLGRTWSPLPLSADFGSRRLYVVIALIFAVPFYVLVLLGICVGELPRRMKVLLLAPAVYLSLVHAVSVGSLRYRVPVEPPLTIIAAAGAVVLLRRGADSGKSGQ
jgi:hypothetical protein